MPAPKSAALLATVNATAIRLFHDQLIPKLNGVNVNADAFAQHEAGPWRWIEVNHVCNTLLWNEEDKARRTDVPAGQIAACKRSIDGHNQRRNDAVESLDTRLLESLVQVPRLPSARLHSETPGAIVDRLSILSLKIHHMRLQTQRQDADAGHVARCEQKLQTLTVQRADLCNCLDLLLGELALGSVYFKLYRQHKMYNDPTLNPYLYTSRAPEISRAG
jgi:hypothetical protein